MLARSNALNLAKGNPTGTFTIKISFVVHGKHEKRAVQDRPAPTAIRTSLKQSLAAQDGDVEVRAEGATLRAHSYILSLRSPVIKAMLDTPMQEAARALVPIEADEATARAFLEFLYTEECGLLDDADGVCHLLKLGSFFQVPDLVAACLARIEATVTPAVAIERLMLAAELGLQSLQDQCARYLATQLGEAQETEQWQRLKELRPQLAFAILEQQAPRKRQAEDPYAGLTVAQLRQRCADRGLPTTGSKAVLLDRLRDADH